MAIQFANSMFSNFEFPDMLRITGVKKRLLSQVAIAIVIVNAIAIVNRKHMPPSSFIIINGL